MVVSRKRPLTPVVPPCKRSGEYPSVFNHNDSDEYESEDSEDSSNPIALTFCRNPPTQTIQSSGSKSGSDTKKKSRPVSLLTRGLRRLGLRRTETPAASGPVKKLQPVTVVQAKAKTSPLTVTGEISVAGATDPISIKWADEAVANHPEPLPRQARPKGKKTRAAAGAAAGAGAGAKPIAIPLPPLPTNFDPNAPLALLPNLGPKMRRILAQPRYRSHYRDLYYQKAQSDAAAWRTALANDRAAVARAGPMGPERTRSDVAYLGEDRGWACCNCGADNSRFEFLCWSCAAHSKGPCCDIVG
ncbi:hypothetical protein MFIFM68171_01778 [Madurella fahalii]|uniref:RanBP2-type domain-containing protein n=1 Tax=Madurella fahalii TaxID=1157608 RepID=A0ABQ0G1D9_9PEZI